MKSLGLVEVLGSCAAIDCVDLMCKAADVQFVSWQRRLGGSLVTVIVEGQVSAVNAAVEAAVAGCFKTPVAYAVIPKPHEETERLVIKSKERMEKLLKLREKANQEK